MLEGILRKENRYNKNKMNCELMLLIFIHIEHTFCICPFLVAFFSASIDGRNLIFGHKLHIGTPISWEAFFDPSDMGPKTLPMIWGTYMKLVTKYQISVINGC
jgi:hypothetical protein